MRITSGTARGHNLRVPTGVPDLRPTKEMVRQAIFSIIQEAIQEAVVLDLFAGTGSLGIEALSRGAKWADFVDINISAYHSIEQNIKHSRLIGKAKVHHTSAEHFLRHCPSNHYHLIFADPPYELDVMGTLNHIPDKLKEKGLLIYLHAKETHLYPIKALTHEETRNYGITGVSFYSK